MLPVKLNKIFLKKINVIGYIFQKSAYISLEKRKSAYLPNQKTIELMQPKRNNELLDFSYKPVSKPQARSHFLRSIFHLLNSTLKHRADAYI
jgi:hypothetical protein